LSETAKLRADMPANTAGILDARTLEHDFKRLFEILESLPAQTRDFRVLDVGCGTGAITRGIAEILGVKGSVLGVDVSEIMLEKARTANVDILNLEFLSADIYNLRLENQFDLVVCARVLQWLAQPRDAISQMWHAIKPGGKLVLLDYNHLKGEMQPTPPSNFSSTIETFYRWKADAGMDNEIADHLQVMLLELGFQNVLVTPQLERTVRGDADFDSRMAIKVQILASRGHQLVKDGWLTETERAQAEEEEGRIWTRETAQSQTLYLLAIEGRKTNC
jgi:ubiquinone/menaquinone biosynthesis C-methylase UbiE